MAEPEKIFKGQPLEKISRRAFIIFEGVKLKNIFGTIGKKNSLKGRATPMLTPSLRPCPRGTTKKKKKRLPLRHTC